MRTSKFYVYELIDPRDKSVFYVGKGKGNRVKYHWNDRSKHYNQKMRERLSKISSAGYSCYKYRKLFESPDEQLVYLIERQAVEFYGKNNLCNIMPGGDYIPKKYDDVTADILDFMRNEVPNHLFQFFKVSLELFARS
jgi:hypothetical protein